MATTTVRVDSETHATLAALASASGATLMDTVRDAAEALSRQRFGARVTQEMAELRADDAAWRDYEAEMEITTVADGLDR